MKIVSVTRQIKPGGFGVVDEVMCDDGCSYARKTFAPSPMFATDIALCEKLKARFIREVRTQEILPNEYFIPILFHDLSVSEPYFIMPIAEDVYTEEIIRCKKNDVNPEGLGDILNALEFLHDKALVHRDLKPQNILKHNGVWKLADFGLVSHDKEILSQTITTSKQAFGTPLYCAPEQIMEFSRITPQADIYSFGAILHDIFTDGNRVPFSELTGDGDIGQIIEKCTKNKKEHRFRSIKSIRSKLLTLLSTDTSKSLSGSDQEWQDKFSNYNLWTYDTLESFIFYLKKSPTLSQVVFNEVQEVIVDCFHIIDIDLFNVFSLMYLDWVCSKSFVFNYCDVVVNNIYYIYRKSNDIEVKSKCAISAAELGYSHNRWYVMGFVVKMSNSDVDDNLAYRIGMEIELDYNSKNNFIGCVTQIGKTINSYHRLIQAVL
jgi:serine/threonine protein kinase